ncbi:MAG TPA: hypothetical protein VG476_08540, partial [Acidimicrobiales bacterium]|nr:hypothetical protein [Acidimicrobiales bacterium]
MAIRTSHLPLRAATGAFILNSGINHRDPDEETAKRTHAMAAQAYPFLQDMDPQTFVRLLAAGEIALGAALVIPIVPSGLAGLGLAAFSGGLLGMYTKTPFMHEEGSLRPTPEGIGVAKDSWMAGIAAGLIIDEVAIRLGRRARRAGRKAESVRRDVVATRARAAGTAAGARKATAASTWGAKKAAV